MTREEFKSAAQRWLSFGATLATLTKTDIDDRIISTLSSVLNNTQVVDIIFDIIEGKVFAAGDTRFVAFMDSLPEDQKGAVPWVLVITTLAELLKALLKRE